MYARVRAEFGRLPQSFTESCSTIRFPLLWLGSLRLPEDGETSHMPTVLASVRAVHVRGDDLELMLMVESCMHGREDLKLLCGGGRSDLWCNGKENVPRSLIICALLFAVETGVIDKRAIRFDTHPRRESNHSYSCIHSTFWRLDALHIG